MADVGKEVFHPPCTIVSREMETSAELCRKKVEMTLKVPWGCPESVTGNPLGLRESRCNCFSLTTTTTKHSCLIKNIGIDCLVLLNVTENLTSPPLVKTKVYLS
jgi:hypothetical protein